MSENVNELKEQVNNAEKKNGRKVAAVILMVAALLFSVWFMQKFMCIPFSCDEIRIINFHKEPKDSIDVLLVGSSATYSDFSSVYAYEKYGFTSFPYAIGGSTCTMWEPALRDALKTQKELDIDRKKIDIKEPIKVLGKFECIARIYPTVTAKFTVDVRPE